MRDWYDFPRYPKTTPRKARDGIKARSRSGAIGERWWSRRFIEALETFADRNRIRRGRSYARSGQVTDLDIRPGIVTARVQGSRARPYDVGAEIDPFSDADWLLAERAIAAQALFLAALLAGEMPSDIEDAFAVAGLELFPTSNAGLRTKCSCPDWANPCKHVAATLYILAEAFDEDPFLILAWRGRDRHTLLDGLRERRAEADEADDAAGGEAPDRVQAASPHDFWRAGPGLLTLQVDPRATETPDAVLRELGPLPFDVRGRPATDWLAEAYRTITTEAERRAFSEQDS